MMKILKSGKLVKNLNNDSMGIIVKKSTIHDSYWKVFSNGSILDWHVFNIGFEDERSRHKISL